MGNECPSLRKIVDRERSRLLKAFHAFKSDPSDYNLNRIKKAAESASDIVYVTNALGDFAKRVSGIPRYSDFDSLYWDFGDSRK